MELSKTQRNNFFHAIVRGKLDPADCEILFTSIPNVFTVTHFPTKSRVIVSKQSLGFDCTEQVGNEPEFKNGRALTWTALYSIIERWAGKVADWAETPDLWEIRHDWKSFASAQDNSIPNTPFTQDERLAVSSQLKAIREDLKKTYELTEAQEAKIDEHFKEAEEASKRLGRKDWIVFLMGTAVSLVITGVVTPEIFQHILMMAFTGLEHILLNGAARGALGK